MHELAIQIPKYPSADLNVPCREVRSRCQGYPGGRGACGGRPVRGSANEGQGRGILRQLLQEVKGGGFCYQGQAKSYTNLKLVSIRQHSEYYNRCLTVEIASDVPDDVKTKALGSYYFISPLLVSGFNIY